MMLQYVSVCFASFVSIDLNLLCYSINFYYRPPTLTYGFSGNLYLAIVYLNQNTVVDSG